LNEVELLEQILEHVKNTERNIWHKRYSVLLNLKVRARHRRSLYMK